MKKFVLGLKAQTIKEIINYQKTLLIINYPRCFG